MFIFYDLVYKLNAKKVIQERINFIPSRYGVSISIFFFFLNSYQKRRIFYLIYQESAYAVGRQLLDILQSHRDVSVGLRASTRPVLITLDPRPLLQFGHHDDGGRAKFPHHPPVVAQCLLQRSLRTKRDRLFGDDSILLQKKIDFREV